MQPSDFIDTAEKLVQLENPSQADLRSAASRSYYAVYSHVKLAFEHHNMKIESSSGWHRPLVQILEGCQEPELKDFGTRLGGLLELRHRADYQLDDNTFSSINLNCQLSPKKASLLINEFNSLNQGKMLENQCKANFDLRAKGRP